MNTNIYSFWNSEDPEKCRRSSTASHRDPQKWHLQTCDMRSPKASLEATVLPCGYTRRLQTWWGDQCQVKFKKMKTAWGFQTLNGLWELFSIFSALTSYYHYSTRLSRSPPKCLLLCLFLLQRSRLRSDSFPEHAAEHSINVTYTRTWMAALFGAHSPLFSTQLEAEMSICQHSYHPGENHVLQNLGAVGKMAISNRQLHSVLINVQRLSGLILSLPQSYKLCCKQQQSLASMPPHAPLSLRAASCPETPPWHTCSSTFGSLRSSKAGQGTAAIHTWDWETGWTPASQCPSALWQLRRCSTSAQLSA